MAYKSNSFYKDKLETKTYTFYCSRCHKAFTIELSKNNYDSIIFGNPIICEKCTTNSERELYFEHDYWEEDEEDDETG